MHLQVNSHYTLPGNFETGMISRTEKLIELAAELDHITEEALSRPLQSAVHSIWHLGFIKGGKRASFAAQNASILFTLSILHTIEGRNLGEEHEVNVLAENEFNDAFYFLSDSIKGSFQALPVLGNPLLRFASKIAELIKKEFNDFYIEEGMWHHFDAGW